MLIVHKVHEGKHQYEVENVVKHKKTCGEKTFARYDGYLNIIYSFKMNPFWEKKWHSLKTNKQKAFVFV